MKTVPFGTTDLSVSNLCLGTMQFGWTADEDCVVRGDGRLRRGRRQLHRYRRHLQPLGAGNPGGVSEEIIGRWMKARGNRNKLVVATKVRGQMWDGPDGEGLGREHIERAVEDSLRRLQVETIDLYQTH